MLPRRPWSGAGRRLIPVVAGLAALGTLTLGSAGVSAASTTPRSTQLTTVVLGVTSVTAPPTWLPLIAEDFGYARKNHLQFQFDQVSTSVTAQVLSDDTVNVLAASSAEPATLEGAPFKIIAGAALSYWQFWAKNSIKSWSDLIGKTIGLGCSEGSTCSSTMEELLAQHGINPSQVTFVYTNSQANYEALQAGSVDAALTVPPYTFNLASDGGFHAFSTSSIKPYLSTQFTTTTSWVEQHETVANEFVKSIESAEQLLAASPVNSKVLATINKYLVQNGVNPETLDNKKFLEGFTKSWAIVPTKQLITRDLALISAEPDSTLAAAAKASSFSSLVYELPAFRGMYG